MKAIEYFILRFCLFVFFALLTSPVVIISILLMKYFDAHDHRPMAGWIIIPVCLTWLFGNPWLASQAARHMTFEHQTFGVAVKLTFYDLRVRLSFLPVVGHWFEPHTDTRDADDDDI